MLHFIILQHFQFTAWPEVFSYPYLLNNGFDLYKDIALPYQPILVIVLALVYEVFGYNLLVIQFFTWMLIASSDLLILLISRKLLGKTIRSLWPVAVYVLIQPLTSGNMLWFDLATVPFILLGILFSLNKQFFLAGIFWGIPFFIKQQTGVAILFLIIYFLFTKRFQNSIKFFLGFALIALSVLIFVSLGNIFNDYFFWTTVVPLFWYPKLPGYSNWPTILQFLVVALIFLPGVMLAVRNLKTSDNLKMILLAWLGLFLIAFPRFDYFRFQPALAVYMVLLAAILKKENLKYLILPIILAALILTRNNLANLNLPARFYGSEELMLAKRIKDLTLPNERVYMLGVPSIGYVLSNRLPPKPWIDNYVWYLEIEGLQEKVIQGFERDTPKVIFWKTPQQGNWYDLGTYQPKKLTEYIKKYYEKIDQKDEIEIWTLRQAQGKPK